MKTIFIIISCLIVGSQFSWSQALEDMNDLSHLYDCDSIHQHNWGFERHTGPYYAFFVFYKKYISSQDAVSCVFQPSCSVYMIESIKKQGWLKGFLDGMDRLSRCHGFSAKCYEQDEKTGLLKDKVDGLKTSEE